MATAPKAWLSDTFALAPLLSFRYANATGTDAAWHLRPEVVMLFVPFKSTTTRFALGGGLGFDIGQAAQAIPAAGTTPPTHSTTITLSLPVQAGVEHFFTRWFSMGIATRVPLIAYTQDGDYKEVSFAFDSTSLLGQMFFYTD